MSNLTNSLYNLRQMDDLADQDTLIHRIHPLVKLLLTLFYLIVVVSFDRYEIIRLIPLCFYPLIVFSLAELPLAPLAKKILIVQPFIIGAGVLNPLFDSQTVVFAGLTFSRGWLTFISIFIKSSLTVAATLLLIATTGMHRLAAALRLLRIPRLFVLQLLLTYRYISVLGEEANRLFRAYSLRAPRQKGVHHRAWGSLAGQLLLRTLDRAQRVYQAMALRGFTGEYFSGAPPRLRLADLLYLILWAAFFLLVRFVDIPSLLGSLLIGASA
ncbi:MAG: cobalt ECF transporter T component CbiQ [Peptococcaceae bacterium]|jgi:cobalt/nickel transport system permease protein|nr:cobalt ECF transporter T component CbiQ [Peptococcaceae bacterium]